MSTLVTCMYSKHPISSCSTLHFLFPGRAAETIDQCLTQILKYIEDVQAGKTPSNGRVGRLLMETISRVPKIDNTRFEQMLNSTMQVGGVCCHSNPVFLLHSDLVHLLP